MTSDYDYIICGSGLAGLSLLARMMKHDYFSYKQILVVDKAEKNINDHTWCYWEKEEGFFESIVHRKWKQLDFWSTDFSARFDITPYQYKMIRSIDLYNSVLEEAKQLSNIHFVYGNVQAVKNENGKAVAVVDDKEFTAHYIFNSIVFNQNILVPPSTNCYYLLQHFKGWLIETSENIFDESIATFMDFRIEQNNETIFVYVLPVAKNKALVEYTLFSKDLLQPHLYDDALKQYISQYLKTTNYKILEEEVGVIPMTNYKIPLAEDCIINIGTAGGQTKPSSGFTFRFIQKHSDQIINALLNKKKPQTVSNYFQKRFAVYDAALLDVLSKHKLGGDKIFAKLFSKNKPQLVLKFLDNETILSEELKIMSSVPAKVFLPAALQNIFK